MIKPNIILIMVNVSLINNNSVIESMTSNPKHRTSSEYYEYRKSKN